MIDLAQDETIATGRREMGPGPEGPAPPAPASSNAPARLRIGKYEIVKPLGRGGMGAVYQAFDPVLEREVALKVMLPETAGDPEQKQRFEREARAIARLSHPGIVTVFDLGYHTDGSPYIVMELLKGRDLHAGLRETPPLSLREKVSIVIQVLDGLGHAHKAGIVHRDIKPANVFLTEEGAARIMDFGIAFWTSSGGTSRTVLGTVAYMSPEQVRGERVDGRSDIFSVGTLLYEVLTGRRPFDAETPMATFYRISRGEPALDLPAGPEYQGLLPVLRRALALAVEERFPTASEFAAALRAWTQDGVTLESRTATAGTKAAPEKQAPVTPDAPERRADPSRLLRLLREIYVGGKSGHLHLAVDGERKSLRIRQGQIVHGTSDAAGEHLGDVLVRYGLLSQEDLDRALAVVLRERRRLGAVLVELSLLEKSRIEEAVGLHAREILFNAIGRPGVTCAFEELADSLLETDIVCPFSTGQLILEATRRILDPELVRTVLGDLGRVLALSSDPLLRTQRITLTPADGFVLSRVDGSSRARDVMALVPLPAEDVERSLFSLLCTGIVDYRPEATSGSRAAARTPSRSETPAAPFVKPPAMRAPTQPAPVSAPRATSTPSPSATGSGAATGEKGERPARATRSVEEIRSLILETHARLKRDHFEVMGLERTATTAEVREAYGAFARILHPDASRDPALEDLREKREAVFIRLSEAHEVLRDEASRAKYERAFEPSKLQSPRAPRPPRVTSGTPGPEVPPHAPETPMRAPASPPPAPSAPPPRPATPQGSSTSTVDARLMPERILEDAERLFAAEEYWEAIQQLEPMVRRAEEPTRARARMLLARAYMKNPQWRKRAEGVLQSLLDENPRDVAVCLVLAELYRDAHLLARARALYRKVLDAQPRHAAATEALAALEPGAEEAHAPSGIAGLFKRR
jgi:serine/threonine protein kinase/tetratricopeptide (TPR) repeat protein